MIQDRVQSYIEEPRLTPWVGRIMVIDAVVLLLLATVFTAPVFVDLLQFAVFADMAGKKPRRKAKDRVPQGRGRRGARVAR